MNAIPRRLLWLCFISHLVLHMYFIDAAHRANTTSRALVVWAIFNDGTIHIDPLEWKTVDKSKFDGHFYSDKPPLPSFIVAPIYGLGLQLGIWEQESKEEYMAKPIYILGALVIGAIPAAILGLWLLIAAWRAGPENALLFSFFGLFGSFMVLYSSTFFSHFLLALMLVSVYHLLNQGKFLISGLIAGLGILVDFSFPFFGAVFGLGLFIRHFSDHKKWLQYLIGLIPGTGLFFLFNYLVLGNPFDLLINHLANQEFAENAINNGLKLPNLWSLFKMLFSSYKGVFIQIPLLGLMLVLIVKKDWQLVKVKLWQELLVMSVVFFLFVSTFVDWHGGWCFGPRYMLPLGALYLFVLAGRLQEVKVPRKAFMIIGSLGVIVFFLVKSSVIYSVKQEFSFPFFQVVFPRILDQGLTAENNFIFQLVGVKSQLISWLWPILFAILLTLNLSVAKKSTYET